MSCSKLPAGSYLTLARLSDLHLHKLSFPPVSSLIEFATESKFKLAEKSRFTTRYRCSWRQHTMFFLIVNCIWIKGFCPCLVTSWLLKFTILILSCHLHCFIWTLFLRFYQQPWYESILNMNLHFAQEDIGKADLESEYILRLSYFGWAVETPFQISIIYHVWCPNIIGMFSVLDLSQNTTFPDTSCRESIIVQKVSVKWPVLAFFLPPPCPACDKPPFCFSNWKLTTPGNSSNKVITG